MWALPSNYRSSDGMWSGKRNISFKQLKIKILSKILEKKQKKENNLEPAIRTLTPVLRYGYLEKSELQFLHLNRQMIILFLKICRIRLKNVQKTSSIMSDIYQGLKNDISMSSTLSFFKNRESWEFWSRNWDSLLSLPRVQVRSLPRKLRFHKPHSAAKKQNFQINNKIKP